MLLLVLLVLIAEISQELEAIPKNLLYLLLFVKKIISFKDLDGIFLELGDKVVNAQMHHYLLSCCPDLV